ncbi:MAG: MMPL family transporter [Deltaproteobacteria bacterium]
MSSVPDIAIAAAAALALLVPLTVATLAPELLLRGRMAVLATIAALTVAALTVLVETGPLGLNMTLDPSEGPLLDSRDPDIGVYNEAVANFGEDDLFVVAMTTATGDVFNHEDLSRLRRIGDAIRRVPGVRSAKSLANTVTYRYLPEEDLVELIDLIDEVPSDPRELAALRQQALSDRIYPRTLVSTDGRTAAINVSFRRMSDGDFVRQRLDERVTAIVEAEQAPGVSFHLTGRQHIKAHTHAVMVHDLARLIPLAIAVGAVVAWLLSRSVLATVLPVGASVLATLWVYAVLAWLDRPLNLITVVLGPMLICVGSVYGVHVLARFEEFAAARDGGRGSALRCLEYCRTPVGIAATTTVIGFGALLTSPVPAIDELGTFAVLGIVSVTMISLAGIPSLLSVGTREHRAPVQNPYIEQVLSGLARLSTKRPGATLTVWTAAALAAVISIPAIVVDTDYLGFFDRDSTVRRDFAAVNTAMGGSVPLYLSFDGGHEGAFREPANLQAIARMQAAVDALPEVASTVSALDLIEPLNRAFEDDDPAAERIPDTRGEVADLMFVIPKAELRQLANSNHSRANLVIRTAVSGSAAVGDLERKIEGLLAEAPLPDGVRAELTGNTLLVNHGADIIADSQARAVGLAAIAIFILIWRFFGSAKVGALAMVPNLIPVVMFFGLLGAGAATLSLPTSLIGCAALGIAIDDTAHFLVAYRQHRAEGWAPHEAAALCTRRIGRPIVATSMMLVAGFLVLTLSGFATIREFGGLSAAVMLVCLAADLTLLPAILTKAKV